MNQCWLLESQRLVREMNVGDGDTALDVGFSPKSTSGIDDIRSPAPAFDGHTLGVLSE
ncbi:hypothetical protein [Natrinema caseinilyticum]|uniref:hypothetical protein n=1 Tax=Natrinema caseinilyticum TaxID=2961570 RepID=UPI0020C246DD|nr:hypothetical protein [Natrinema caseinilyticum]